MSISSWTRGVVATASDPQARAHVVDACWLACGAGLLGCPTRESLDRLAQGEPALGQGVGPRVVTQGQSIENSCCLEFAETNGEHIRPQAQVALQVAIALRTLEKSLDDEQSPPRADDLEGCCELSHRAGSGSDFIQYGE